MKKNKGFVNRQSGFTPTPSFVSLRSVLDSFCNKFKSSKKSFLKTFTNSTTKTQHKTWCRGFTLIELLVVIAIIGVLASVVLSSLNSARNKAADVAVKANLANARAQAEIFYDSNANSYVVTADSATDVCYSTASVGTPAVKGIYPNVLAAIQASQGSGGAVGHDSATAETTTNAVCFSASGTWVAQAKLKSSGYWCVDYLGTSEPQGSPLAASSTQCL